MQLPEGLTSRPVTPADVTAVFEVVAAQQLVDLGEVYIEEADLISDWQRPSFDLAASSVAVFDRDLMVGYAEISLEDRGDAAVRPEYQGRGIGTQLARWMQATARARGSSVIGMPVPQGSAGDRLLESLGYHVRWTSWALALPEGTHVPERPLPPRYTVRAATETEHRACWTVVEDAFLEWSARERCTFEDWQARVPGRPGFEPWHLRVVLDPADEVVASASLSTMDDSAFVNQLATRRDLRGQGLAQALLADAFATAAARGFPRAELSTDSRTGALGLYERVGMQVTSTWLNRAINL